MSNRETPDARPGEASTLIVDARITYGSWLDSVARYLSGHGFLTPRTHMAGCASYMLSAYEMGMTAVRCANNIAKAKDEGRFPGRQKGTPSGVV